MLESVESKKVSGIVNETKQDSELSVVARWLLNGFPNEKQDVN